VIWIDEEQERITIENNGETQTHGWNTAEGFAIMSNLWLRSGWGVKHVYTFTWLGRPMIQLPEDMLRVQELIGQLRPDVIIETGIAHGGSLVFYASLCHLLGQGRVIGIDIEIRPHNRAAIEEHPLFSYITLMEGNSVAEDIVASVKSLIQPGETVLVLLDSSHSKDHVLAELNAYAPLVTVGSYIIAMDGGIMQLVQGAPRTSPDWVWNNPNSAVAEFLHQNVGFVREEPPFLFNEGLISEGVSYWRGGYIKRVRL
jgi:cephalosporin hydroxylase